MPDWTLTSVVATLALGAFFATVSIATIKQGGLVLDTMSNRGQLWPHELVLVVSLLLNFSFALAGVGMIVLANAWYGVYLAVAGSWFTAMHILDRDGQGYIAAVCACIPAMGIISLLTPAVFANVVASFMAGAILFAAQASRSMRSTLYIMGRRTVYRG